MADGNSIINLGDLAKPATVLIEKISNAVGVLYEPRRVIKKAHADAEAEKIKALAGIELTEIEQRAIERHIKQESKKQENIEKITAQAAINLPPNAKPEEIEDDWITHFFDKCDKISNEQMQSIWSNLLSGEATQPGTYSKRTVDLVASMDRKDADLFTRFCQFTWMVGEPVPMIFDVTDEIYSSAGLTFSDLKHLDAIGLISFESVSGYAKKGVNQKGVVFYFGNPTFLKFPEETNNKFGIGQALFTQAGKELVAICNAVKNDKFVEYCIDQFEKQGIEVNPAT